MMASPIFIIGTPRSGTTLCGNILGSHSNIFVPGETHYFTDIFSRRAELGDPSDPHTLGVIIDRLMTLYGRYNETRDQDRLNRLNINNYLYKILKSKCSSYENIFTNFMMEQARDLDKSRWANHAPKDIFNIKDILSLYPDAKIILCVRDIRDFLVSYKTKWKVTTPGKSDILKNLYHPITTSLQWKASMKNVFFIENLVDQDNFFLLKYENLVRNPEHTIRNLCRFIGETFEPQMLNIQVHNSSTDTNQNGIFTSSIGRWRSELTDEEVFISQIINRKEMFKLGYCLQPVFPEIVRLLLYCIGFPTSLIKAIKSNRKSIGPIFGYISKRILSLIG